jgi:hypothetical protein
MVNYIAKGAQQRKLSQPEIRANFKQSINANLTPVFLEHHASNYLCRQLLPSAHGSINATTNLDQIIMFSNLYDSTILKDVYAVSLLNTRQSVSNGDASTTLRGGSNRLLHQPFRMGVKGGGGFIQY